MDDFVNERKLKRHFPNASKSFIERNKDNSNDSRVSKEPKSMDGKRTSKVFRGNEVGAEYRLCRVEVAFFAGHGKKLDEDNRRYCVKPILDALVSLGFARDDKDITSETTQRMDADNLNL